MFVNYVLYPEEAETLHKKYGIEPLLETRVGVLGHVLYNSFVKSAKLLTLLRKLTAQPFYVCYPRLYDLNPVAEIYKAYLSQVTGVTCELQFLILAKKTYIYPVYKGNYLYFHDDECNLLRDLSVFTGRALLSASPATRSFCERYPFFPEVREQHGVYTCNSRIFTLLNQATLMEKKNSLQEYVTLAEENGYYSVAAESTEGHVALELASVWNIPLTLTPEHVILHYKKEDSGDSFEATQLGLPFASWVAESIQRILSGQSPVVRVLLPSLKKNLREVMIKHNALLGEVEDSFRQVKYENNVLVQVPVFDLDDYRVFERVQFGLQHEIGAPVSLSSVPEPLSVTRDEEGWLVVTGDGNSYLVSGGESEEKVLEKWRSGTYFSPWGRYCLAATGLESIALIR